MAGNRYKRKKATGRKGKRVKRNDWREDPTRYKRAINSLGWRATNPGLGTAFPTQKRVTMRYCTAITLNPNISGALAGHVFSANGIYDPDVTSTGHQPMGFDQWASFYNNWTVVGSKLQALVQTDSNDSSSPGAVIGCYLDSDTLPDYTTFTSMIESGRSTWNYIWYGIMDEPQDLTCSFSARKFFGVDDVVDSNDYGGSFTQNPNKDANYVLWAQAVDQSTDVGAITFLVTIDYIVQLREPKGLDAS